MIYILYSGDYEVFLGGNYRPEREVIIETTEKIFEVFRDLEVPLTLFADVCCLWRYRDFGLHEFPDEVEDQLKRAVSMGHDVQAHIHPHWSSTRIERDDQQRTRYQFDPATLLLGTRAGDVYDFALNLMQRSRKFLTDLLQPVDSQYDCVAFRAGAYGVQPMPEAIYAAMRDVGFVIDSSIVPGLKRGGALALDFTRMPNEGNYYISSKCGLSVGAKEGVYEIPVLATRLKGWRSRLRAIFGSISRRLHKPPDLVRRGYSATGRLPRPSLPPHHRLRQLLFNEPFRQLELSDDVTEMIDMTQQYIGKHWSSSKNLYFAFSFHPKDTFPSRLEVLKKYHLELTRIYGASISAITFQEAERNIRCE